MVSQWHYQKHSTNCILFDFFVPSQQSGTMYGLDHCEHVEEQIFQKRFVEQFRYSTSSRHSCLSCILPQLDFNEGFIFNILVGNRKAIPYGKTTFFLFFRCQLSLEGHIMSCRINIVQNTLVCWILCSILCTTQITLWDRGISYSCK